MFQSVASIVRKIQICGSPLKVITKYNLKLFCFKPASSKLITSTATRLI